MDKKPPQKLHLQVYRTEQRKQAGVNKCTTSSVEVSAALVGYFQVIFWTGTTNFATSSAVGMQPCLCGRLKE